jgi:hypothetical protein
LNAVTFDGQTSSTSVSISVVNRFLPQLQLNPLSSKYNYDSKIILTATVLTNYSAKASWSTSSISGFESSGIALTPLFRQITMDTTVTSVVGNMLATTFQLAIAPYSLTTGISYTFQLSAIYDLIAASTASISATVLVNAPPQAGEIVSDRPDGFALKTIFSMKAQNWIDDPSDYPLSYAFFYYTVSSSLLAMVKNTDAVSYVASVLGQGLQSRSYAVTLLVVVQDFYACASNATTIVTVNPPSNASAVMPTATAMMNQALNGKDSSGLFRTVGAVLTSVNAVNCTTAISCASLHRQDCQYTRNTCGSCLTGYAGVSGDSNFPCQLPAAVRTEGQSCSADSQCSSGKCAGNKCKSTKKPCISSCNNAGSCKAFNNNGKQSDDCAFDDNSCMVRCQCNSGRYGKDCSLTTSQYNQLVSFRQQLCNNLYESLSFQDLSNQVMKSRATTVADILVDIDTVSNAALLNCTAVLVSTINANPSIACDGDTARLLSTALSQVLQALNNPSYAIQSTAVELQLFTSVQGAVGSLSVGCQTLLALGEAPVAVVTENIRVVSAISDQVGLLNLTMYSALSAFEKTNNKKAATVHIDQSFLLPSEATGLTLIQYGNNPQGLLTNSSIITLQTLIYGGGQDDSSVLSVPSARLTSSYGGQRRLAAAQRTPNVTTVLQNTAVIEYVKIDALKLRLRCDQWSNVHYTLNATCPDLTFVNLTCPINMKGVFNVTCPSVQTVPRCTTWNGEEMVVNSLCRVISYSAYNTTCQCDNSFTERRRLQSGSSSNFSQQYSTTLVTLRSPIDIVFEEGNPINFAEYSNVVLSSVLVLAGLLVVGLLSFYAWSHTAVSRDSKRKYEMDKHKSWHSLDHVRTIDGLFYSILPADFREIPWRRLFCRYLTEEHTLLGVFPFMYEQQPNLRHLLLAWISVVSKTLTILLLSTTMAWLYYADDNSCQQYLLENDCRDSRTFFGSAHACKWREDNGSCEFLAPDMDVRLVLLLTMIIVFIALPYNAFLTACTQTATRIQEARPVAIAVAAAHEEGEVHMDEEYVIGSAQQDMMKSGAMEEGRAGDDQLPQFHPVMHQQ